jgi:hypothetical protein
MVRFITAVKIRIIALDVMLVIQMDRRPRLPGLAVGLLHLQE